MKVAKALKPQIIIVLGDFLDCYSISDYDKDPKRETNLNKEAETARTAIKELEALNAEEYYFFEGNHEERLTRLITKVPELDGLIDIENLLKLSKKWKYIPYKRHKKIGKLNVTHDVGFSGQYATFQTLDAFQDNAVFGHTHRASVVYRGTVGGKAHVCLNSGWGGDVEKIDYMHTAKARRDWMLGFSIAYMEPDGVSHCFFIPVINYKCVVNGVLYEQM